MMKKSLLLLFISLILPIRLWAQFTVIDAIDRDPVAHACVYNPQGEVIAMSDSQGRITQKLTGQVTIQCMAYANQSLDVTGFTGTIELQPAGTNLQEVVFTLNLAYIKSTMAFREVYRNNGRLVLYREGIADYYQEVSSGKTTVRIRKAHEYEHAKIRKPGSLYPSLTSSRWLDLSNVSYIQTGKQTSTSGDTVKYEGKYRGKTIDNAVADLTDGKGLYHSYIDLQKVNRPNDRKVNKWLKIDTKIANIEWIYTGNTHDSRLVSVREYRKVNHSPQDSLVVEETTREALVIARTTMSRDEAKAEMKEKEISDEFEMPREMPAAPFNVQKQTATLLKKNFWKGFY